MRLLLVFAALTMSSCNQPAEKIDCSNVEPYVAPQPGVMAVGQPPRYLHEFHTEQSFEGIWLKSANSSIFIEGAVDTREPFDRAQAPWLEIDTSTDSSQEVPRTEPGETGAFQVRFVGKRVVKEAPFACWGYGEDKSAPDLILVEEMTKLRRVATD